MATAPPRKDLLVGDLMHLSPFEPILLSILSAGAAGRRFSKFGTAMPPCGALLYTGVHRDRKKTGRCVV
jgi:hypothetical protein